MKKELIITTSIFLICTLALILPFALPTWAGTSALFNVSLTISNVAPTIVTVDSISNTPSEGTTKIVSFYFNASDSNGIADIPASNALIKINRSGTSINSGACTVVGSNSVMNRYECNVTINFYHQPGLWSINASIYDGATEYATNLTEFYTNGNVYGIALKTDSLTFSGSPGQNDVTASNNPQQVNNTGNVEIPSLNVTAYSLSNGATVIGARNFTINASNNAVGQQLINNTVVTVLSSNVSVQASQNLYIFLDIPSGVTDGSYISTDSWVVTLN